jgi:4-diphosphocytidyl-2-C-methyl-D-erythritol kinase
MGKYLFINLLKLKLTNKNGTMILQTKANAKINIGLSITEKRMDGFHNIETLFYPVTQWCDWLVLQPGTTGFTLEVIGADFTLAQSENICTKACSIFVEHAGIPLKGGHLILHKNIPSGAGLGGGSADAACTLKLINELNNNILTNNELKKIALTLGSDVPFFIDNKPAFATGRGECLTPFPLDLSAYHIEIVKPNFSISTAEAYTLVKPAPKAYPLNKLLQAPIKEWKNLIINDFEAVLFPKYPELAALKHSFYERGACYASLSGSGSACYGIFPK